MVSLSEDSMNSIGNSFEQVNHEEIGKVLQALELLLNQAKTPQYKNSLKRLKLFLSKVDNDNSGPLFINEIYKSLIKSLDKEPDLDHAALCEVLGLNTKQAELDYASDLADLIEKQIAGFDEEKLRKMCIFSKISYGDVDRKLEKGRYKTKRQFEEEGYQIIKFYDNELIEDKYCLDTNYKLEQHNVGYALTGSNSYNRDSGYVFIKDQEVTIAYHGTRDLNDVKEDLRASLAKLSFLPEDHRVHSGFYSLFKRSWPNVHKILKGHANDKGLAIKDLKINVTGHSMGGALASIAALCLNKTEDAEKVHVATFGSPRVFYNGAADVYDKCLGNKTVRVACQSDPVPCLPHGNAGMHYKHVGKPLKLETGKTLEYLEPHYHKIDTYYNLIQEVQQENFKSDNNPSKYRHIAYICGLFYHAVLSYVDVNDQEFFKKVEEENKGIKLSEIPIEYSPKLEERFKQGEQEVAQLTDDKTQLEKGLAEKVEGLKNTQAQLEQERSSVQQELAAKIEELEREEVQLEENKRGLDDEKQKVLQLQEKLKDIEAQLEQERKGASEKLTQEQQKTSQLNGQVDQLNKELKGIKDQLAEKTAELDKKINKVTELNVTIEKCNETNIKLEKNVESLNDQLTEEKRALKKLKVQSEQNEKEFKKKIEELNSIKQGQASKIAGLTAEITELKKAKTELEEKVEFTRKELEDAQAQLKESERGLDVAKKNILQLEKDLKQAQQNLAPKTKEFENAVNKLQKGLDEKTSEAVQLRGVKAQFEQENRRLASQLMGLEGKCEQTEVQLAESKQSLAKETNEVIQLKKEYGETKAQLEEQKDEIEDLNDKVTQLTAQSNQLKRQMNHTRQGFTDQVMQLKNENNDLRIKLQEPENKSKVLEKNLQKQSESKDEELNEKFLKARIYSKKQGNYASVSFVLSGAFAVGASLTMLHLAICVSLIIAASTFLAVGCYCSYKANTALSDVEVAQIGNDPSHSVV